MRTGNGKKKNGTAKSGKRHENTRRSNEKAAAAKGGAVRMWGATSSSHSTRKRPSPDGA